MKIIIKILLLIYLGCSTTDNKSKDKELEVKNEIVENPLSKNNYNLKLVAPLLNTPEVKKIVDKRKKDFSWRYDFSQNEYQRIVSMRDNPENRKQLIQNIESKDKKYGFKMLCLYKLLEFDIASENFEKAKQTLTSYNKYFPEHKEDLTKLSDLLKKSKENVQLVDLGNEINFHNAYLPIPELSEKKIYYTTYDSPGGAGGEDVVEASFIDGKWTNRKFTTELNTKNHDSPTSISADGTKMILFGNYFSSFGGGDLFLSELQEKGWSKPMHLGHPVNSTAFDSDGIFTPDGKAFLFVSDREGSYYPKVSKNTYNAGHTWGNTDIYISFIQEDGTFGEPINLGPMINTPGAERQPFLHPDGKTLYFSSNGFNINLGNLDVYKAVRLDDTWINWSEPVNLGKEINTVGADWGFKLNASGERGYISRYNVLKAKENLYSIEPLPKIARPNVVIAIEGNVIDENENPLEVDLEWEDLNLSKPLGKLKSKPSGEFFITLPVGKVYAYFAKKQGYLSKSESLDLTKEKNYKVLPMKIKMTSISHAARSGQEIVLGNILFQSDKDVLDKRSFPELDRLVKILQDYPNLKIEIQGHTSAAVGRTEDFNLKLSQNRANSVATYLQSKGIEETRLQIKGYGSSVPLLPNTTEENKAKNRRVSFKILEN